ncbi:hypothetical protein [Nitrosospira briensis]|uniref:hypothetical protein n=1 Tax=Nitrosospira briensis TaxID=35799 RepID=UPI00046AC1E6|nr:hypothetical protein [Nitrosospira briensis]
MLFTEPLTSDFTKAAKGYPWKEKRPIESDPIDFPIDFPQVNRCTSPPANFVGVEAYVAAGGLIRLDLFGQEDEGYMQDAGLLERLAVVRLDEASPDSKRPRGGLAWIA